MPDESHLSSQQRRRIVLVGVTLLVVFLSSILLLPFRTSASAAVERPVTSPASQDSAQTKSPISIDYPEDAPSSLLASRRPHLSGEIRRQRPGISPYPSEVRRPPFTLYLMENESISAL